MPNYVKNILKVRGDTNRLVKFVERHINDDGFFDFNTVIPEPKYRAEAGSKYFFNSLEEAIEKGVLWNGKPELFNWYDWRIDNWGTKWNSDGLFNKQCFDTKLMIENEVSCISIVFETAWEPPVPVVEQLIKWYHEDLTVSCDYYSFESMVAGCVWYDSYSKRIVHDYYTF